MALRSELIAKIGAQSSGFRRNVSGLKTFAVGAFAAMGAAISVAFAIRGIRDFVNFLTPIQTGMAEVNTIAQVSKQRLRELEDASLALGSRFGVLSNDSIPGLYQALSAGVPEQNVMQFMDVAAQASIAGVTTLETAVDGLTTALNAYGRPVSEANEFSDVFFETIRRGKTTFTELAPSIGAVLPLASAMGISFEEVGAAIATLTVQGASTSEAVTRIRSALTATLKPTADMSELMDRLRTKYGAAAVAGLSFQDRMQLIRRESGGSNEVLATLFGRAEAVAGVLALTGDNAAGAAEDLQAMRDSAGATAAAFAEMEDTAGFQFNRLRGAAEEIGNILGRDALPVIADAVDTLVGKLQELRDSGALQSFAEDGVASLRGLIDTMADFTELVGAFEVRAQAARTGATGTEAEGGLVQNILEGERERNRVFQRDFLTSIGREDLIPEDVTAETLSVPAAELSELAKAEAQAAAGRGAGALAAIGDVDVPETVAALEGLIAAEEAAADAAGDAADKQGEAADKQNEAAETQKDNAESDRVSNERLRQGIQRMQANFQRALEAEAELQEGVADAVSSFGRERALGQFEQDFVSGRFSERLSGRIGSALEPLVNRFGIGQVMQAIRSTGDLSALAGAGQVGDMGEITAAQAVAVFDDVRKIREKVDKMAGLTGN